MYYYKSGMPIVNNKSGKWQPGTLELYKLKLLKKHRYQLGLVKC